MYFSFRAFSVPLCNLSLFSDIKSITPPSSARPGPHPLLTIVMITANFPWSVGSRWKFYRLLPFRLARHNPVLSRQRNETKQTRELEGVDHHAGKPLHHGHFLAGSREGRWVRPENLIKIGHLSCLRSSAGAGATAGLRL